MLSTFSWTHITDGVLQTDYVNINDTIQQCDVRNIICLPTVVIGISDIPYQTFILGKLNMGTPHCNYCTSLSEMFGKEDEPAHRTIFSVRFCYL